MPENPDHRRFFMIGASIGMAIGMPLLCVMKAFFGQRAGEMTVIAFVIVDLPAHLERHGTTPQAVLCQNKTILHLLVDTGCRAGDLRSMIIASLDLDAHAAIVKGKNRGGPKKRLVFYGKKTTMSPRDWLYYHPLLTRVFFASRAVNPLGADG